MRNRFFVLLSLLTCVVTAVLAQPVTITPPSATIQPGGSVTLTASGAMYYQWSPAAGLSTTEGPVTIASPTVTTTYTCEGYAPGDESVVNGDFNQGNTGFTSSYEYNSNLWGEGTYYVDSDASLHHENFHGYGHGGSGNFMMVNGAISPNTNVWTEQISVNPNKWYAFSTWACTLAGVAGQMALLQFSINGTQIGEVFSAPASTMVWEQFYELWYSGNSTSATITILNQNTNGDGNDFGLDDISFRELVLVGSPTCTVYIDAMSATASADETELCEGQSTILHALPTGGSGNYSFSWTPAASLNNANVQHPVATPSVGTTTYSCLVTDNDWGGTQNVSVGITVFPNAESTITEFICSGESYNFYGTEYDYSCHQTYTDHTVNGCDSIVHLDLTVYPANDTTLVDPSICVGQSYNFHGTLYDQDGQVAWFDTIDNHGCLKVEKLVLTVDEYQTPPVLYQYECYEHGTTPSWTWDKTGITYHENTVDEIILPDPNGGCDFRHRLNLQFHEEFYQEEEKVACDFYTWPVNGVTYHESQDEVAVTFHTEFGDKICDSTYVLRLHISDYETNTLNEQRCDSYLWDPQGMTYTTEDLIDPADHIFTVDGSYHRTYKNVQGCDSIVTMNLDFDYTPNPSEIYPVDTNNLFPHWVVTATEFQINSYEFSLWDHNSACEWDSVTWAFENPDVVWLIEVDSTVTPIGKKCRMYVLNYIEDTVWLRTTVYNRCAPEGIEGRYWFVCSFYGVEEHQPADFNVVPNPNNGQMTLRFEHLTGNVDVKVYDMKGRLVDEMECFNESESSTIPYHMGDKAEGVYCFVATGKEGTISKKVIVE